MGIPLLAAFDLDGTLLKKNSSFAFCRFLCEKRFLSKADLFFCAGLYMRHCYFSLPLYELHTRTFNHLFKGKKVSLLLSFVSDFIKENLDSLWYQPALVRLRQLQAQGARCVILSSSPLFLVAPLAEQVGVHEVYATQYKSGSDGILLGLELLMDGAEKAKVLESFHERVTVAFSDSELDLPFLEKATIAVAVNPKSKLKKVARLKKWEIL